MAPPQPPKANLFKQTFREFADDDCPMMASSLAYYTIFSLPPLLVIVITIAGFVWGDDAVKGRIAHEMEGVVGKAGVEQINTMIDAANKHGRGIWATLIGIGVLIFGATGVVVQLQSALNRVWEVKPDPRSGGFMPFVRKRLLSFAMILGIGFLLMVSLVMTAALSSVGEHMASWLPEGMSKSVLLCLDLGLSLVVFALLFAGMFKWLPDANVTWRQVALGATLTSVLFLLGKFLLGLYLGRQDPSAYGPAAALVLILVWVYYSSMILFMGAEFTQVWAQRHGERIAPAAGAVRIDEADRGLGPQTA